jgi:ABC-type multidrug transport system fused ATPase/permease subunit
MLLEGVGGCEVKWSGPSQGVFLSFFFLLFSLLLIHAGTTRRQGFLGTYWTRRRPANAIKTMWIVVFFFLFFLSLYDYFRKAPSTFMYTKSENRNERKKSSSLFLLKPLAIHGFSAAVKSIDSDCPGSYRHKA